jgi:hypothetical protein
MITLKNLWENREEVISRCKGKEACVTEFTKLIKAENETDFKNIILNNFNWVNFNQIIDEPRFDWAGDFQDGMVVINVDEHWGHIKHDGSYLVEPKFDYVGSFQDGVAWVRVDGVEYQINTKGERI